MAEERTLTANFTGNASGFSRAANETVQHLRELNTEMAETKNKIKETNSQIKEYEKELERMKREIKDGEEATEEQRHEMQRLEDAIAQCNVDLGTHRTTQQRLQSEIRSTNRQLDEQRTSAQTVSQAFTGMGDILKANLLSGAIMNGFQELLHLLKSAAEYAYQVGSSFEAAMSQVGAISGATGSELDALNAKAKEMGASTKFTATQAAEALNYMAMAGWKTEDMLSGIDGVINLAAASGEELAAVSDIVTDALTAFGLAAKDSGHFADVLAAASANSNTNVAMMGETFKYAAPIAGALGYSIEDTAVAIGIMANSGIKASQAGTALRTIMTNLSSDVKIAGESIGEVTIATTNADGSMREFSDIIADLREAFAGLSESEKTATAESLAGKYAMSGFLSLMNAGQADVDKLTVAIENCDGATSKMADTMQNNLKGSVTVMQSALEGFGISLYDRFSGGLKEAVDILTDGIGELDGKIQNGVLDDSMERLSDNFVDFAEQMSDVAVDAIPDFLGGLADLISFVVESREEIGALVTGFVAFKTAMTGMRFLNGAIGLYQSLSAAIQSAGSAQAALNTAVAANPFGVVAAAVGALAGVIALFANNAETAAQYAEDLRRESESLIETARESQQAADDLKDFAEQYKNLKNSSEDAKDVKEKLEQIQQELNNAYGIEAAQIDLVNGKYETQIGLLNQLASKKNADAEIDVKTALLAAQQAEQSSWTLDVTAKNEDIRNIVQDVIQSNAQKYNVSTSRGVLWDANKLTFGSNTSYEARYNILSDTIEQLSREYGMNIDATVFAGLRSAQSEMKSAMDNLKGIQKSYSDFYREMYDPTNYYKQKDTAGRAAADTALQNYLKTQGVGLPEENVAESAKGSEEEYKAKKQLLSDQYSVDEISKQEYYDRLKELRDQYLESKSHEWYQVTKELNNLAKSLGETSDHTDKLNDSLSEAKKQQDSLIAAIDRELELRGRKNEDDEYSKKINELNARLNFEKLDDFSRMALEQEKSEIVKQREDVLFQRMAEDAKAQINADYKAYEQTVKDAIAGKATNTFVAEVAPLKLNYDPTAWEGMVNSMFSQYSETVNVNTPRVTNKPAPVVNNNYITIQADNKTPKQIYEEIAPYIGGGI